MPNTKLEANFAETRSYRHAGREVDRQTHLGLDLASTQRAPVPAPNGGRVLSAGWMTLYGNAVVIDHGYGLLSLCGHLSAVTVAAGDTVARGTSSAPVARPRLPVAITSTSRSSFRASRSTWWSGSTLGGSETTWAPSRRSRA
jgi:hypothetical protein